jgi:hypothetical protein
MALVGARGRRQGWTAVALAGVLGGLGAFAVGCGSYGQSSMPSTTGTGLDTTSGSATTATPPPIPAGGTDCGTINLLSGWPTTLAVSPTAYGCITDAAASGTPARMIVISAGDNDSGRQTSDGYAIPTHHVVTWVVLGPGKVQQTTDLSEDGGAVTVVVCTGLSDAAFGSVPVGTDCVPA